MAEETFKTCDFEQITKTFINFLGQRYPSVDSLQQEIVQMFNLDELEEIKRIKALIIVLSVMRDAVREVSVDKLYRSIEHRDEVYSTIIDALEDLEEDLEELEYEEEEDLEEVRREREKEVLPEEEPKKEEEE